ncbi:hypothetical protein B296_00049644 [Ensete ventricosum]|uniref:Uncharacterized protein n=1 Tax=Ensete ventricosum TaxID=4639 RepID=A0A426XIZ2_ENSVE|nr:hypothetical protein B296_00049644 [Ensete ventricosum]
MGASLATAPRGGHPLWVVAPTGDRPLQVADSPLAGGLGRSRLPLLASHCEPLLLVVLIAIMLNDSMRFNLITRSLKSIFCTKTLALIAQLGNLSGCIICAIEIKTKIGFSRRSNRRAKDWGREKIAKIENLRCVRD